MFSYHTPTLLHKLNPTISELCWRCGKERGTLFHLFWDCPGIRPCWTTVNALIYDVLGIQFSLNPKLFLLNITEVTVPKNTMKLQIHIMTAARCRIALFWKWSSLPTFIDLLSRIKEVRNVEYKADIFHVIWSLWDIYILLNMIPKTFL